MGVAAVPGSGYTPGICPLHPMVKTGEPDPLFRPWGSKARVPRACGAFGGLKFLFLGPISLSKILRVF